MAGAGGRCGSVEASAGPSDENSYGHVAVVCAVASAWLGHLGAITLPRLVGYEDTNTAGMMAVAAGGLFFLAVLFARKKG